MTPNERLVDARMAKSMAADFPTVRFVHGPTILLRSGVYLDLLEPEKCSFTIDDIAQGLAHVCRFAGQCEVFYSVAEHSVHVSHLVPPEHAYAGLMHDAAEAFIGDVTKPLKTLLPEYKAIEQRIETAIFERFDVPVPGAAVKHADMVMLGAEQRQLMHNGDDWYGTAGDGNPPVVIRALAPISAKDVFLRRFLDLTAGRAFAA